MTKLLYQRKNKACILKDCWYHKKYDFWARELQRNIGYEPLDEKKILATAEDDSLLFKPYDSGLHNFGPAHVKNALKSLNLKIDTSGLFYYHGLYRIWEEIVNYKEGDKNTKALRYCRNKLKRLKK